MKRFFFLRIFPGIFAVVGILILFWTSHVYLQGQASKDWPAIEGRVTSTKIEKHRSQSSKRRRSTFHPIVTYDFTVDGTAYSGDRVAFNAGQGSGDRAEAQAVLDRYPVDCTVTVYYDPTDPSESVLEPGTPRSLLGLGGIGLIFAVVGLGGLVVMPWAWRRGMVRIR